MPMKDVIKLFDSSENKAVETKNKSVIIRQHEVDQRYQRIVQQQEKTDKLKIDPSKAYKSGVISEQNDKYQQVIDRKLPFINDYLSMIIPVTAGTVFLIGGVTGGGKSTTVANIIIPLLDSNVKVLVVSNEERRNDIYSRVACRNIGQSFHKLKRGLIHEETRKLINAECDRLETIMTVIGTDFQDDPDMVCTPEGLKLVFEHFTSKKNAERGEIPYVPDVILFDYYQNIATSLTNDDPSPYTHQETFARFLNSFKNSFDGPIFVMSQLHDAESAKQFATFKSRLEGRKYIANIAPFHIEIRPNKEDYTTLFKIHKDRLTSNDGAAMRMGFDKDSGKFVPCDTAFQEKAAKWVAERLQTEQNPEEAKKQELMKEGEVVDRLDSGLDEKEEMIDELDFDKWTSD